MFLTTLLFWVVQVSRVHVCSCLVEYKLICGMVNQLLTDGNTGVCVFFFPVENWKM